MVKNPDGSVSYEYSAADQALSREAKETAVRNLYLKYLGREPDTTGLNFYVSLVEGGRALIEVERELAGSIENYLLTPNLTPQELKMSGGLPLGYEYLHSNLDDRIRALGKTLLNRELFDSELELYFRFAQSDGNLTRVETMMKTSVFNPATNAWTMPEKTTERIVTPPTPGKTAATVSVGGAVLAALALFFIR